MANQYLNTVANVNAGKRAWQTISIVLGTVIVVQSAALLSLSDNVVTRLVPYGFDTAKGIVELRPEGRLNVEYIAHIGLADIKLLTDWTPNNVKVQFNRFLNRCAPEFRHDQVSHLIAKADEYVSSSKTQVFFPDSPKALDGKNIEIDGRIQRWISELEIVNEYIKYKLSYRYIDGVPYVTNLTMINQKIPDDKEVLDNASS